VCAGEGGECQVWIAYLRIQVLAWLDGHIVGVVHNRVDGVSVECVLAVARVVVFTVGRVDARIVTNRWIICRVNPRSSHLNIMFHRLCTERFGSL
jgi:hypothetical protein